MVLELAPRGEYWLVKPLFRQEECGGRTFGGPNRTAARAPVPVEIRESTMHASFTVSEGETQGFAVHWAPVDHPEPAEPTDPERVAARIEDTVEGWRSWEAEHDIYEGPHHDLVRLSSRVLKGLSYRPTGAIVAAPTTSL